MAMMVRNGGVGMKGVWRVFKINKQLLMLLLMGLCLKVNCELKRKHFVT